MTVCGIDGSCGRENMLASDIVCSAAFAFEGFNDTDSQSHWNGPVYRLDALAEEAVPETGPLFRAILAQRKAILAVSAPHDIVLLRGSYVKLFVDMMSGLQPAMRSRDTKTAKTYIAGLKESVAAFASLSHANAGTIFAGMPREDDSSEFTGFMGFSGRIRQSVLMTLLIGAGEFAGPLDMNSRILDVVRSLPIKDKTFADMRDAIIDGIGGYRVLYYRPKAWTPAFRIEIPGSLADDSARLADFLTGIDHQCITTGINVPFPLYCAAKAASNFRGAVKAIRASTMPNITSELQESTTDILPFLKDNDMNAGVDNE